MTTYSQILAQARDDLEGFEGRVVLTPMTSVLDGRDHAVPDVELVTGGQGRYRALCGSLVVPGSLMEEPGRACPVCVTRLAREPAARVGRRTVTAAVRAAARRLLGRPACSAESRPATGRT